MKINKLKLNAGEEKKICISQFLMGVAHDNQVYVKTYFDAMKRIMKSDMSEEEEKLLSNLLRIFNRVADQQEIKDTTNILKEKLNFRIILL